MRDRIVMGSAGFLKSARALVGRVTSEQSARRFLSEAISFERIVEVVEEAKEERWERFHSRYGDWGRPLTLYLTPSSTRTLSPTTIITPFFPLFADALRLLGVHLLGIISMQAGEVTGA